MKKLNTNGSSLLHIVLILVIVGLIGGVGYYVYNSQKKTNTTLDNTAKSQGEPQKSEKKEEVNKLLDDTDSWLLYSSKNNEYKIRLADGLVFESAEEPDTYLSILTDNLTTKPGVKAQIIKSRGGRDGVMGMYVNYFKDGTETKGFGVKQASFKTKSGLDVDKYYYIQESSPDGIGLEKGGKEYTYLVTKDTNNLKISYSLAPNDTGSTDLIEKMVKTVEMQ